MYLVQNFLTIDNNYEKNSDTHIMVITDIKTKQEKTVFLSIGFEVNNNGKHSNYKPYSIEQLNQVYQYACNNLYNVFNAKISLKEYARMLKDGIEEMLEIVKHNNIKCASCECQ